MTIRNLRTLAQFCAENPAFTENAMRWHVFNARVNGLEQLGAIYRIGRKVLIDVDAFYRWLDEKQNAPGKLSVRQRRGAHS